MRKEKSAADAALFCVCALAGLHQTLHFAGTKTTCANTDRTRAAINHDARTLEVRRPGATGLTIGVTNFIARMHPFAANGTYPCHGLTPPFSYNIGMITPTCKECKHKMKKNSPNYKLKALFANHYRIEYNMLKL